MIGERADVVAIMAAIIYAGRTGESGQVPNEKMFGLIAKAAWELHRTVMGVEAARTGTAALQEG